MEVQALFDEIEYQKGGAVLRMLWNYMASAHYASARLPANVQLGHDVFVRPSRPSMACPAGALPAHAFSPMCSLDMHWLRHAKSDIARVASSRGMCLPQVTHRVGLHMHGVQICQPGVRLRPKVLTV